jgi:Zn-dependent peptidase ImmA (M78 family)
MFLSEPPKERLPIPHFRTIASDSLRRPSPELLETVQAMERRQAWMREFFIEEEQEPLSFVRSAKTNEDHCIIALRIRSALGLRVGWAAKQRTWTDALGVLRKAMDATGILVVVNGIVGNNTHRKLDTDEFRGFVLVDDYAPLVFVNGADGKAAQMFTLAHELAHVWFGASAAFDLREMRPADDSTEQACDRVAAEFLVPEAEFRRVWPATRHDPRPFQSMARHFKVSELVAARRALDLRFIRKGDFLDFYQAYQERERQVHTATPEGGDFYANQNLRIGRRFAGTVIRAVREGKLLHRDAYNLTDLWGTTFERYALDFGAMS